MRQVSKWDTRIIHLILESHGISSIITLLSSSDGARHLDGQAEMAARSSWDSRFTRRVSRQAIETALAARRTFMATLPAWSFTLRPTIPIWLANILTHHIYPWTMTLTMAPQSQYRIRTQSISARTTKSNGQRDGIYTSTTKKRARAYIGWRSLTRLSSVGFSPRSW